MHQRGVGHHQARPRSCRSALSLFGIVQVYAIAPTACSRRTTRLASALVEVCGMPVLSLCRALTMRLSRNRFVPPNIGQKKLALCLAPLRVSA